MWKQGLLMRNIQQNSCDILDLGLQLNINNEILKRYYPAYYVEESTCFIISVFPGMVFSEIELPKNVTIHGCEYNVIVSYSFFGNVLKRL